MSIPAAYAVAHMPHNSVGALKFPLMCDVEDLLVLYDKVRPPTGHAGVGPPHSLRKGPATTRMCRLERDPRREKYRWRGVLGLDTSLA
jgi:hypothetical protein